MTEPTSKKAHPPHQQFMRSSTPQLPEFTNDFAYLPFSSENGGIDNDYHFHLGGDSETE